MTWLARCDGCEWRYSCADRALVDKEAWRHEVFHWTEESCKASGVPFHVTDANALRNIAVLLRAGGPKGPLDRL